MNNELTHQIACDNGINALRLENHLSCHRINQHLLHRNIREVLRDLRSNLIPKHHTISLSVTLCNDSQMLSRPLLRDLKGEADKSVNSMSGEDGHFCSDFPRVTAVRATALSGVFAFAVLTDNYPVEISCLTIAQG